MVKLNTATFSCADTCSVGTVKLQKNAGHCIVYVGSFFFEKKIRLDSILSKKKVGSHRKATPKTKTSLSHCQRPALRALSSCKKQIMVECIFLFPIGMT